MRRDAIKASLVICTCGVCYNKLMLLVDILKWWYVPGFSVLLAALKNTFAQTLDQFSFGTLLRTLFAPFRQIDAGTTGRSLGDKLQAWLSRLISRLVGFVVRTLIFLMGLVVLVVKAILSLVMLLFWPVAPVLPVVFLVCAILGVGA